MRVPGAAGRQRSNSPPREAGGSQIQRAGWAGATEGTGATVRRAPASWDAGKLAKVSAINNRLASRGRKRGSRRVSTKPR